MGVPSPGDAKSGGGVRLARENTVEAGGEVLVGVFDSSPLPEGLGSENTLGRRVGLIGSSALSGVFKRSLKDFPAPSTLPKGLVVLANAEKPPVTGLGIVGVFGVVEGVGCPKTEDRPKTGVVVKGAGDVVTGASKVDTLTGVVVGIVCAGLKNGELLSGAPKTLSPSEKVDCLRLANAPPMGSGLSAVGFPKGDGGGLCPNGGGDEASKVVGGLGDSGEEAGDGAVTSCWDLFGALGSCFG